MKRSEMINHINQAIKPHVFDKDPTYISECILSTIEGGNYSGDTMIPVSYKEMEEWVWCPMKMEEKLIKTLKMVYEWEPEE